MLQLKKLLVSKLKLLVWKHLPKSSKKKSMKFNEKLQKLKTNSISPFQRQGIYKILSRANLFGQRKLYGSQIKTKDTSEKLEIADKEAIDAELAAAALKRRVALLEEEADRNKAKLQENITKCSETEKTAQTNEEGRRAGEARSFAAEQALEAMESELEEANAIASASNHKYEDVNRKLKVVEGDLERIIERAEEFENKTGEVETQVRELEGKVKETEAITIKNTEEEDRYENKILKLQEEFKLADTRAEFAERSGFQRNWAFTAI